MKFILMTHNVTLTKAIEDHILSRIWKLEHLDRFAIDARVTLEHDTTKATDRQFKCSLRLAMPGPDLYAEDYESDLYAANIHGPVYDLPTTLSKFLLLGLGLREVIERSTANAARAFNFGAEIGTLEPGAEADVSVFDLKESDFTFTDADGKSRTGRQKLVPVATVRGGKVFLPAG